MKLNKMSLLLIIAASLSGCSSTTLKAPCSPSAGLGSSPCGHIPINVASLETLKKTT